MLVYLTLMSRDRFPTAFFGIRQYRSDTFSGLFQSPFNTVPISCHAVAKSIHESYIESEIERTEYLNMAQISCKNEKKRVFDVLLPNTMRMLRGGSLTEADALRRYLREVSELAGESDRLSVSAALKRREGR